ncbi:hypothetical protein AB0892_03845 [Streptomyces sp. NPDC005409]|uniref:hypothetical protein n=1 Tax=Streptomyces sp. NPDC005409 TaxID=3155342 RepID=UPI003454F0E3
MDEQGGAGGIPPHVGHEEHDAGHDARKGEKHTTRSGKDTRPAKERTAAADTDEASRLDRPKPGPGTGRGQWVSPRDAQKQGEDDR